MLRLLYFYDFTSWNAWSIYDRDQPDPASPAESPPELGSHPSSSDSAGPSSPSGSDSPLPRVTVPLLALKKAIDKTPSMAWQEIGSILGLDIHRIEEAQREYDYFRQQTKEIAQVHKRHRSAHEPTEDLALPRGSSIKEPPSKRVQRPFVPPKNVLTWEECCKSRSSKAKTELSEEDKLSWELDSEKFRKAHEGFHVRDYTGKERVQHAVATNPPPEQENSLEEGQTVIEKSAPPHLTLGIDPPVIANPSQNPRPQKKKATVSIRSNDSKPKNTSSNGEEGSPRDSRKGKQKSPMPESWLSTQPL